MLELYQGELKYVTWPGTSFFSFEDNIPHCMNATLALILLGCPIIMFDNAFWRDYLNGVYPENKSLFCLKYVRLVHAACNFFRMEISYMAIEGFPKHGKGFVASAADF